MIDAATVAAQITAINQHGARILPFGNEAQRWRCRPARDDRPELLRYDHGQGPEYRSEDGRLVADHNVPAWLMLHWGAVSFNMTGLKAFISAGAGLFFHSSPEEVAVRKQHAVLDAVANEYRSTIEMVPRFSPKRYWEAWGDPRDDPSGGLGHGLVNILKADREMRRLPGYRDGGDIIAPASVPDWIAANWGVDLAPYMVEPFMSGAPEAPRIEGAPIDPAEFMFRAMRRGRQ